MGQEKSEMLNKAFEKDVKVLEEMQGRYLSLTDVDMGLLIIDSNDERKQMLSKLKEGLIANYNNYMAIIKGLQSIWSGKPVNLKEYYNE